MPFPTEFPAKTTDLISYLRGGNVPVRDALEVAYDLVGFALGQMVQKPPASPVIPTFTSAPLDKPALADELEQEFYAAPGKLRGAPAFAFDWVSLLGKMQKLIPVLIALLS